MPGKRATRKHNKKTTNIFNINVDTDFRDKNVKTAENQYVANLLENKDVFDFACKILFLTIQHCKKVGLSKDFILGVIKSWIVGDILVKLGYTEQDANTVCNITTLKEFTSWNRENKITICQLMSAYYKFETSNLFLQKCIEYDNDLKMKFMETIRDYFKIPKSMDYSELKDTIIEKSNGYWFYLWVVTFLQSSKSNLLHRRSDSDDEYVRMWIKDIDYKQVSDTSKFKLHKLTKNDVKYNQLQNYSEKTLVIGKTYQRPRLDGIWINIMKKYKKEVISGPSGSACMSFQNIFEVSKIMPKTNKNKILLLLCCVADMSIYYHSISEIIQTYVKESGLPDYSLDMDDVQYLEKLKF